MFSKGRKLIVGTIVAVVAPTLMFGFNSALAAGGKNPSQVCENAHIDSDHFAPLV